MAQSMNEVQQKVDEAGFYNRSRSLMESLHTIQHDSSVLSDQIMRLLERDQEEEILDELQYGYLEDSAGLICNNLDQWERKADDAINFLTSINLKLAEAHEGDSLRRTWNRVVVDAENTSRLSNELGDGLDANISFAGPNARGLRELSGRIMEYVDAVANTINASLNEIIEIGKVTE